MSDDVWESLASAGWTDLAENLPGVAVRRQVEDLRARWSAQPLLSRLFATRAAERAWERDADAEETVARKLGALGPAWLTLHGVPVGRRERDVDQLLIGPGGVFTVAGRSHPGKKVWVSGDIFMVNGFRQPHVRDSRYKASRARMVLSSSVGFDVPVIGVVALVGTTSETVKEQPRDAVVHVSGANNVRRWIQHRPERLSADAIARVYAMARRSSTWSGQVAARLG